MVNIDPTPTAGVGVKKIEVKDLRLSYGPKEVIHGITFDIYENEIFGIIGPAQSGKTSLLRCINRTIDFTAGAKFTGTIQVDGRAWPTPVTFTGCVERSAWLRLCLWGFR
jgi:ABC-type phosphate transport system ATPase subunit